MKYLFPVIIALAIFMCVFEILKINRNERIKKHREELVDKIASYLETAGSDYFIYFSENDKQELIQDIWKGYYDKNSVEDIPEIIRKIDEFNWSSGK